MTQLRPRGLVGEGGIDRPHDGESIERFHQVAVGAGLVGKEDINRPVEQQQHGTFGEIAHLFSLTHGETRSDAAHIADLEIEQNQGRVDLTDCWHHVHTGTNAVQEMGAGNGGFDLVGQAVGIGTRRMFVTAGDGTRRPDDAHVPGPRFRHESGVTMRPVLEIRVERAEETDYVQLCPEGELDAYSGPFREALPNWVTSCGSS